jgi:hypothetical protein
MKRSCQRQTTVLPLAAAGAVGGTNNDPRALQVLLRAVAISDDRLQAHPIRQPNGDGNSFAHYRQSHETKPSETPFRILPLGAIH